MRPNKPGLYWWKDDCCCYHVAEFDDEMETLESCDTGYVNVEEFEHSTCFLRWVGPAHPPEEYFDEFEKRILNLGDGEL